MKQNLSVWHYYQKDFVDPLFAPYQRYRVTKTDEHGEIDMCPVNTFSRQGCPDIVQPALVRKGWGQSFQLKHPDDPPPPGWIKGPGGWCVKEAPEYVPLLYTKDAFVPRHQFFSGSALPPSYDRRISEQTDMRSVSPLTGEYEVFFLPTSGERSGDFMSGAQQVTRYGALPSKDSYFG